MAFNLAKCKVMHIGHRNPRYEYSMQNTPLEVTEEERDLGVITSSKLKPGAQCTKAAKTAQAVLGQIARAFHFRDRHIFLQLYITYVRPHLEFAGQAWSPWTAADKAVLEQVQIRAIRMVSGLRGHEYEDRLKELGLTTLEERRHQADMAMAYKILTKKEDVDPADWFVMAAQAARVTRTAADPLNVTVKHSQLNIRRHFFSVRVTEDWNKVPGNIKKLRTLEGFKNAYAKHRANIATEGRA